MKLLRTGKSGLVFQLGPREKQLLFEIIKQYPLVPVSRHQLSRGGQEPDADENQRLLEEALAEQRAENRRQVLALLKGRRRFRKTKSGFEFTLRRRQIEWLLQVLNDIRVGSWLALGEPEQGEEPEVTEQNVRCHFALQVSDMFQSGLLAALGVSESPDWAG